MAAPYLEQLETLVEDLGPSLPKPTDIICKHFFSGAAAYADGQIFMSLSPVGLALKLPEDTRTKLVAEGGTPLRYFPKAPIKKDYVVLPKKLRSDRKTLAALVGESLDIANKR